jgi:hypothetical protein
MIRLLKGNKDSASKSRTRAINQIKAILVTAPTVLWEQLEPMAHDVLIATCTISCIPLVDSPMVPAKNLEFLCLPCTIAKFPEPEETLELMNGDQAEQSSAANC